VVAMSLSLMEEEKSLFKAFCKSHYRSPTQGLELKLLRDICCDKMHISDLQHHHPATICIQL